MSNSKQNVLSSSQFLIVAGLFLLSGMSSLVYQVIWTRLLVFVFGSTTFATSTVLSVFMGGLALGSYVAGVKADKVQKPLLWYGILELIIGVWAVITPVLFSLAIPIYKMSFEALHLQIIAFGVLRYCIAAVILLLPTACMGATLPLLSRYVTESLDQVGDRVGTLYGINTLGAVIGSFLAGFVLIPGFGLSVTTLLAALVNGLLMVTVLVISKLPAFVSRNQTLAELQKNASLEASSSEPASTEAASADSKELKSASAEETGPKEPKSTEGKTAPVPIVGEKLPLVVKVTMLSFGISGALAMIYEVAWTRALLMVIGSTTHAFTVMLSAFLVGIFLGSLICARFVDRLKSPILWFAFAEITLCLFGLGSLFVFNELPRLFLFAGVQFKDNPDLFMAFRFFASGLELLPISLCLGAIFPLAVKVCARDLQRIGRSLGQLYSVNTIGAIIGAFLAGFVVIPCLGSEQALILTSVANLVLGVVLLICFSDIKVSIKAISGFACIAAILSVLTNPPSLLDYNSIVFAQTQRRSILVNNTQKIKPLEAVVIFDVEKTSGKLLFYEEGKCANVAVRKAVKSDVTSLITNGHIDASDKSDMQNQALLGFLPLLPRESQNDEVCVVGWGSGVTCGYALRFPIKAMICSELEPVVLKTSSYFHSVNYKAEQDKRTIIEPSDGRNYLLGTSRKFDVIMSEPSNPWQAGVCNLFTTEYFQICRESLKPGGVFTLWTQINEIPTKDIAAVLRSLHDVFPTVFVFDIGDGGDINALAYPVETKIKYEQVKKNFELPEVVASIKKFRIEGPEDFIAHLAIAPAELDKAVNGYTPNTDDRNLLEYDVAKVYENKQFGVQNREWLKSKFGPVWQSIDWGEMNPEQKAKTFLKIAKSCLSYFSFARSEKALAWARESNRVNPSSDALAFIADLQITDRQYADAEKTIAEGREKYKEDSRFVGLSGVIALKKGDYKTASSILSKALEMDASNLSFSYFLALCYSGLNLQETDGFYFPPEKLDPEKVIELCAKPTASESFVREKPQILPLLGEAYLVSGKYDESEKVLSRMVKEYPNGYLAWRLLGQVYDCKKEWKLATFCWSKSAFIVAKDLSRFSEKAARFIAQKQDDKAVQALQQLLEMNPSNRESLGLLAVLAARNSQAAKYQIELNKRLP